MRPMARRAEESRETTMRVVLRTLRCECGARSFGVEAAVGGLRPHSLEARARPRGARDSGPCAHTGIPSFMTAGFSDLAFEA